MNLKKSKRTIKYLVVHCSATPEGREHTAKDIDLWHKKRGFNEIGYNYVIRLDGTIEPGRDVDKIPAHVEGFNKESIGICYIGGCESLSIQKKMPAGAPRAKDTRTFEQKRSLLKLLMELKKLYPTAKILGHRDFPKVNKACPSFDAKKEYENL
ncbi:N-acetylmuramoyl-L-alanine amidase [Capnocytophaga catalasegens]|uniref:N-acetylmuramoyl-L-alanine amidase n=1 Tax=Capnocytophaga catalasegens TaxID=1004260 RepID=A0AAV5AVX6_9FLAO|nr:N-acetylmuramoyl-L-alanine amidase [Capnocytophaga catalasegens]GIZ15271.1 N-acetylmuramoyl-L-alanine amidase [Capnocytophaga catalasegens]GJM51401.1 N-acetylmuramoyl-L-alanine amidase [Capnocytophaga catalasegens]GJM54209.1 N-acetylmuramoyl-L-alanine amidase [Capnocytophaga catalasegens]